MQRFIDLNKDKGDDRMMDNNKIMHQIFLIKGFQVIRLMVFVLIISYFLGTMWFIITKHATQDESHYTFYNVYELS